MPPGASRDNGLSARDYVALADLDPRVADSLLAALGAAGIAAYVAPAEPRRGGYLETPVPTGLVDRVWVDRLALAAARSVLAAEAPEAPETPETNDTAGTPGPDRAASPDAAFRAIVAGWNRPNSDPVPRWPVTEDLDGPALRPADPAATPGQPSRAEEDHFIPPAPPPLPRGEPATRWGWIALLGGVAVLVVPAMLGRAPGTGLALLAAVAIIVGFGTLVVRMKDRPPTDSGPDDGAVV